MDGDRTGRKFLSDAAIAAAVRGFARVKGVVLLPVLTKAFGTETFGAWTQVLTLLSFLVPLALLGMNTAMRTRFIVEREDERSQVYAALTLVVGVLGSAIALLACIGSGAIARVVFGGAVSGAFIAAASILVPLTAVATLLTDSTLALRAIGRWAVLVLLREFVELACIALILFALPLAADRVLPALLATAATSAVVTILAAVGPGRVVAFARPDFVRIRVYVRTALPLFAIGIVTTLLHIGDRVIVGAMRPIAELGVYAGTFAIAAIPFFALGEALAISLLPTMRMLWSRGDVAGVRGELGRFLGVYTALGIPVLFGLTAIARDLLPLVANADFASSWLLVPIVAAGIFIFQGLAITDYLFVVADRTGIVLRTMGYAVVGNVAGNILVAPRFGIIGVAVVGLCTYVAYGIAIIMMSRRITPVAVPMTRVWRSGIAAVGMFIVVFPMRFSSVAGLVGAVLVGTLVCMVAYGMLTLLRVLLLSASQYARTP